jgi:hypothetical protein
MRLFRSPRNRYFGATPARFWSAMKARAYFCSSRTRSRVSWSIRMVFSSVMIFVCW